VIGRNNVSRRGRVAATVDSIEFADLLDQIEVQPVTADGTPCAATHASGEELPVVSELADLVMFRVPPRSELEPVAAEPAEELHDESAGPVGEPSTVSRFAAAGIDDDRLPLRAPRFRRRRH
jgi:hypothetical protein